MGALHAGHLSLVEKAAEEGQFVVVTIFVNPTQFAPGEDFDKYPRQLRSDVEKLANYDVDVVFAPSRDAMYPPGFSTRVAVEGLTRALCGAHREGHFNGVTTVVAKLFNIIGPCRAIFGRKDYQQLQVVKKMVVDLNMPIHVIGMPTIREKDGLAMSSRNAYLSKEQRERALSISRGLLKAAALFQKGERKVGVLRAALQTSIEDAVDSIDYITATDADNLEVLSEEALVPDRVLLAVAAHVGQTRLIDNTVLGEDDILGAIRPFTS